MPNTRFTMLDAIEFVEQECKNFSQDNKTKLIAAYMVTDALKDISNIRLDHPLQGQTFDGIRDALFDISLALSGS